MNYEKKTNSIINFIVKAINKAIKTAEKIIDLHEEAGTKISELKRIVACLNECLIKVQGGKNEKEN